jgi:hypothetical protein
MKRLVQTIIQLSLLSFLSQLISHFRFIKLSSFDTLYFCLIVSWFLKTNSHRMWLEWSWAESPNAGMISIVHSIVVHSFIYRWFVIEWSIEQVSEQRVQHYLGPIAEFCVESKLYSLNYFDSDILEHWLTTWSLGLSLNSSSELKAHSRLADIDRIQLGLSAENKLKSHCSAKPAGLTQISIIPPDKRLQIGFLLLDHACYWQHVRCPRINATSIESEIESHAVCQSEIWTENPDMTNCSSHLSRGSEGYSENRIIFRLRPHFPLDY